MHDLYIFYVFVQKSILTKNHFLIVKIELTSRVPLCTSLVVRQVGDSHFAQSLNKLREGNQMNKYIEDINAIEYTDVSTTEDHVSLYFSQ